MCVSVHVCETFGPPHQLGFVESAELQEISWDGETDLHPSPWEGFTAWDPAEQWRGQERQVKSRVMRQRGREEERREG